jgi:spermidine synthase
MSDVNVPGSITLTEQNGMRYLHFGTRVTQGAMSLSKPNSLILRSTQDMMFWLMFMDPPLHITQLGLGAGSMTKFCLTNFHDTQVHAVELNRAVIDVAESSFKLPIDNSRLTMNCADAALYVKSRNEHLSSILQSDIFDAVSLGPVLDTEAFYADCEKFVAGERESLGMAIFNLWDCKNFPSTLDKIKRAFNGRVVQLDRLTEGNVIVGAFTGPRLTLSEKVLEKRTIMLTLRYSLPSERWFTALCRPINRSQWSRDLIDLNT